MHHGRRLAVTAGATVLGLAAMSGVGHADTAAPRSGPLADLTSTLTGTINGLTGALTGGGGSSPTGSKQSTAPDRTSSVTRAPVKRETAGRTGSTGKRQARPSGGGGTSATKAKAGTKKAQKATKAAKGKEGKKAPGHLRVEISPDLDLKRKTVAGSLLVDAGLQTLLGPAGLKLEADGRLSAEDISIGDPEAEGGIKLATHLGDAGLGIGTGGKVTATPAGVTADGALNVCAGAGCLDAPGPPSPPAPTPPTPPTPPGTPPPGSPSPSPGLPDLPPSSPLLPDLPEAGAGPEVAAASMAPGTLPDDLPFTGADSLPMAALGLAAILAGGAAVAATRRREADEAAEA
ncbi:hypothetical protein [Spirillospora sp. NPDC029432]|uniref:hypothetical protein n=1 Tax=Spirillospora sp. NPDC029432 TaxID=3154599 RepID=UPI003453E04E